MYWLRLWVHLNSLGERLQFEEIEYYMVTGIKEYITSTWNLPVLLEPLSYISCREEREQVW